jgi:hypothetical protein
MTKFYSPSKIFVVAFLFITAGFYSCKTTREIATVNVKPISTAKLLKNVEENSLGYDNFSIISQKHLLKSV